MLKLDRLFVWLAILLFFLSAILIGPLFGDSSVSLTEAFSDFNSLSARIIFDIRLPRIVFAFLVGAGLALSGSVFQALLRNDLATPYTLGVSSGGALGAVLAIKSGIIIQFFGFSTTTVFSVMGSLLTVSIIYGISRNRHGISTYTLVLAGVTISLFFSALILFVHYLADYTETYRMVRWLMGALDIAGWQYPLILLLIISVGFIYFYLRVPDFNLLLTGTEVALSKGVNVKRLQKGSFFMASVLVGSIVSMAGPIGFIGLIVPHILRLLLGPDHKNIFPAAAVFGGSFLIWCDTAARSIISPAELPVGIITSLLGGPFFIYLLVRHKTLR